MPLDVALRQQTNTYRNGHKLTIRPKLNRYNSHEGMKMARQEKERCFVLLAKFTGGKHDEQEKFAKIMLYKKKLERLYQNHPIRHKNHVATENVLFRILQVQEIGSIQHYHLNGFLVKVHVVEDTNI